MSRADRMLVAAGGGALVLVAANLLKDIELLGIIGLDVRVLPRLLLVILPAYLSYVVPTAIAGAYANRF